MFILLLFFPLEQMQKPVDRRMAFSAYPLPFRVALFCQTAFIPDNPGWKTDITEPLNRWRILVLPSLDPHICHQANALR